MVSHHPTTFGGHRHCGSEDVILIGGNEEDSTCSGLTLPLLFLSKAHDITCFFTQWFRAKT